VAQRPRPLPQMLAVARVRDAGRPDRKAWHHAAAEASGLPSASVESDHLQFVCHEAAWRGPTRAVLSEAARLLRPDGRRGRWIRIRNRSDPGDGPPLATLLKSTEPTWRLFRLICRGPWRTPAFRRHPRVDLLTTATGDVAAVDGPPANTAKIRRAPVRRPAGSAGWSENASICAHSWARPQPHPPPTFLVAGWSFGGTAAKDDGRPGPPACAVAINQVLRQLGINRCRPETEVGPSCPISGGLRPWHCGPNPPRRLRSTRRPWRLAAAPGAGAGAGSKQPARTFPTKSCRRRPISSPGFRASTAGRRKPSTRFRTGAHPHDRAQIEHLALPSRHARLIHGPGGHRVGRSAAGGGAGCWWPWAPIRSWPVAQRGCQELLEALSKARGPVLEGGSGIHNGPLDRRATTAPLSTSSETGQAQQAGPRAPCPPSTAALFRRGGNLRSRSAAFAAEPDAGGGLACPPPTPEAHRLAPPAPARANSGRPAERLIGAARAPPVQPRQQFHRRPLECCGRAEQLQTP